MEENMLFSHRGHRVKKNLFSVISVLSVAKIRMADLVLILLKKEIKGTTITS
jgi:hypothetical protein